MDGTAGGAAVYEQDSTGDDEVKITKQLRDEIEANGRKMPDREWTRYLDSLVGEEPMTADDMLHAEDARAAMAALLIVPRDYSITRNEELAEKAHIAADAMAAERKRRRG